MKTSQRLAINSVWVILFFLIFPMTAYAVDLLLEEKECEICHRFSPTDPETNRKGPDLFFAGSKFQQKWLENFLQKPEVIRKSGYITDPGFLKGEPTLAQPHPSLSPEEAKQLTDFLMTLKMDSLEPSPIPDPSFATKAKRFQAKMLFEREYGCIACHQSFNLAHKPRGGISGPSLIDAGNRLQMDWVYHWLKSPKRFEPKGRMPVFQLPEEELKALTQYILWHKKDYLK